MMLCSAVLPTEPNW